MSLRPCKECKKQISSDAKVCPNCGKKQGTSAGAGCLSILGVLILLGVIGSFFENNDSNTPRVTNQPQKALPPAKPRAPQQILADAKKAISDREPEKVPELVGPILNDPKYGSQARQLLKRSVNQARDELAAGMQNSIFDSGEEVYVKATGPEKETIEFSGPLIGAVWVHQFVNSEVPTRLKGMGFKQAVFVNSITGEIVSTQRLE